MNLVQCEDQSKELAACFIYHDPDSEDYRILFCLLVTLFCLTNTILLSSQATCKWQCILWLLCFNAFFQQDPVCLIIKTSTSLSYSIEKHSATIYLCLTQLWTLHLSRPPPVYKLFLSKMWSHDSQQPQHNSGIILYNATNIKGYPSLLHISVQFTAMTRTTLISSQSICFFLLWYWSATTALTSSVQVCLVLA